MRHGIAVISVVILVVTVCVAAGMSLLSRRALRGSDSPDRRTRALRAAVGWDAGALAVLLAGGVAYGLMAV